MGGREDAGKKKERDARRNQKDVTQVGYKKWGRVKSHMAEHRSSKMC